MTVPDFPPAYAGKWLDENRYEFDVAIELGGGKVMKTLDFSKMSIPEDISREDIIRAMSSPNREAAVPATIEIPITCPTCGAEGVGTVDVELAMRNAGRDPDDVEEIKAFIERINKMIAAEGSTADKMPCPDCVAAGRG